MTTCKYCGEDIEFRYVDGTNTPIHVNGGWCSGDFAESGRKQYGPFQNRESYTDPNARCPVCRNKVFFYQSPSGGRVFFDNLGWPWPKHSCTDNPKAQYDAVETWRPWRIKPLVNRAGHVLQICRISEISEYLQYWTFSIRGLYEKFEISNIKISKKSMNFAGISIQDLKDAPSLIVRFEENCVFVSYISIELKKIVSMKLKLQ